MLAPKQRLFLCVLAIGLCVPAASGQWLETTIPLPDTMPELLYLSSLLYHPTNKTIYVGGADSFLFAVDARAGAKLARVKVGVGPHVLCSNVPGNKVYCANKFWTFNVIDGASNRAIKTLPIEHDVTDMVYVGPENKLYCGNATDTLLRVMDCAGDSVVARVRVNFGPGALCYNSLLNRIYCAHESSDVVTVVDCAADTVVAVIPVGGDGPRHVCYDSTTNAVYTANVASRTVSVIDCAGDTLVRVVAVGRGPDGITAGPTGKVYCTNSSDSSVSVISDSGVKVVWTGLYPHLPTHDPVNKKIYCANAGDGSVSVIDATTDTALPGVGTGRYPTALCLNPAGNSIWAASINDHVVSVIDGASSVFETAIPFHRSHPSLLGYNPTSDRLYCLDDLGLVTVIDGNTNAILRALFVGWRAFTGFVWNPLRNKLYLSAPSMDAVYVLDCTTDRIATRVPVGYPTSLCYNSANDKVYVGRGDDTLLAIIDCAQDSVIRTLPMPGHSEELAYNRVSNKVYCLQRFPGTLVVLDGTTDTVAAKVPLPGRCFLPCFIPPHNKLYVGSDDNPDIHVVDGAGDSLIKTIALPFPTESLYYDLANDRAYVTLRDSGLFVYDAGPDTLVASLPIAWPSTPPRDNGRFGDANLVYCASRDSVRVISGTADTLVRSIPVGRGPVSLAWNPAHSWMYVANNIAATISVLSDTSLAGIVENLTRITGRKLQPTIVRGVLFLPSASGRRSSSVLLDIGGRKVMDLRPGANDVRALAPGVYFVKGPKTEDGRPTAAVRKVVLTR